MGNTINYNNYPPVIHYMGKEYMGGEIVGGGGSIVWPDLPLYWDFTKSFEEQNFKETIEEAKSMISEPPIGGIIFPQYDAVNTGTTITENGAYVGSNSARIGLYMLPSKDGYSRVYEIEFGNMSLNVFTGHKDIFCYHKLNSNDNYGLIFRYSNSKYTLAVWDASWEESSITDSSYFSNSILKVKILTNNKWKIYKDGELIFSPNKTMSNTPTSSDKQICIGSSSNASDQSFYSMYVKNAKAYYEEET